MTPNKNFVGIDRAGHRWIFVYDDAGREACLDALNRCAADPATPFSWADAAEASRQIRLLTDEQAAAKQPHASRFALFAAPEIRRAITTEQFEIEAQRAIDYAQAMHCLVKIETPLGGFYVRAETQLTHLMMRWLVAYDVATRAPAE